MTDHFARLRRDSEVTREKVQGSSMHEVMISDILHLRLLLLRLIRRPRVVFFADVGLFLSSIVSEGACIRSLGNAHRSLLVGLNIRRISGCHPVENSTQCILPRYAQRPRILPPSGQEGPRMGVREDRRCQRIHLPPHLRRRMTA